MVIVMMLRMVLYAPIIAVGGVYKVINTNVSMTWIIALGVVLILALVLVLFLCVMPKFRILQKMVDRVNLVTREILTGLSVIRAFHTEKHEEERFDVANRDLTKTNLFVNRAMTFMMPAMMLIMNGISILIVWVGAHGVDGGWRYDGIYPVHDANHYGVPYDLHDLYYASKSCRCSRTCG